MKKRLALIIALVTALLVAGAMFAVPGQAQSSSTFAPTHDTWVGVKAPTATHGTAALLGVRGPGTDEQWSYFQFSPTVSGPATLRIKMGSIWTPGTLSVFATTSGWTEGALTWNTKPLPSPTTALDSEPLVSGAPVMVFDVGTVPAGPVSFIIRNSNTSKASLIYSKEQSGTNEDPFLTVGGTAPTTTTVAPTTTTVAPTTTTVAPTTTTTPPPASCPTGSIEVLTTDSLQAKLNANGAGTFCLRNGLHRDGSVTASAGDVIVGESLSAIMDGTKTVTNWVQDGTRWKSTGQTYEPVVQSVAGGQLDCANNAAECEYVDLFKNDIRVSQVQTLAEVTAGKFYFDQANDTIWIGEAPGTATWETTQHRDGIGGDGVTYRGFTAQRYAGTALRGGSGSSASTATIFDSVVVQRNHSTGLHMAGDASRVQGTTKILNNGRYGMGCGGGTVEGPVGGWVEIAGNNSFFFETGNRNDPNADLTWSGPWDSGAMKCVWTTDMTLRRVWSHDNWGAGIWFDVQNQGGLIEDNLLENNAWDGVFWELGADPYRAGTGRTQTTIRNNTIRGNRMGCVNVTSSSKVEIYGNTCSVYAGTDSPNPPGPTGVHFNFDDRSTEHDLSAHDNHTTWNGRGDAFQLTGTPRPTTITIQANTYHVPTANQGQALWRYDWGTADTWTQWKARGYDTTGTLTT